MSIQSLYRIRLQPKTQEIYSEIPQLQTQETYSETLLLQTPEIFSVMHKPPEINMIIITRITITIKTKGLTIITIKTIPRIMTTITMIRTINTITIKTTIRTTIMITTQLDTIRATKSQLLSSQLRLNLWMKILKHSLSHKEMNRLNLSNHHQELRVFSKTRHHLK